MIRFLFSAMLMGPSVPTSMTAMMKRTCLAVLMAIIAMLIWGVAPLALWKAWGMWWMIPWLVPTTTMIFMMAMSKPEPGGG